MLTRPDSHPDAFATDDARPPAIVIGAGLGGLAAAMRLGAKGYRVSVLDRLDSPGGRGSAIHMDGHRFDLGPTIVTVPEVFRDLWAACGRDFDKEVDLRPLDPYYEIRFTDGEQFEASGSTERLEAEVKRISPKDLGGFRKFLQDSKRRYHVGFEGLGRRPLHKLWDLIKVLPTFALLRADQSIYRLASRRVTDERLRMALSFHPLFIGGDPTHVTSMYALVSYLEKEFGVHYAIGGVAAMAEAMTDVIRDQGGDVRFGAEVDEITTQDGAVTGVALTNGDRLRAPLVISNADVGFTYRHLLRRMKKRRWTDQKLERTRWSMGLFVWYFGTKGTADRWKDVGHHTILSGPRYTELLKDIFIKGELAEDMSLYVHRPAITDPTVAPDGDDTFYVLSPVPHLGHDSQVDWSEMQETYRKRVAKVLEDRLLPGFEATLGPSHILTPEDFSTRYLATHGSGFSIEPRILQSAWFRPHNISEEVDGLFLVGAGTHPGAGLPGVLPSAECIDQLIPHAETVQRGRV